MAAIDAAWAAIDGSDDPVAVRRARDKAKARGELAATARKIAGMVSARRPAQISPGAVSPESFKVEAQPVRAVDRLNGGGRGR